MKFNSEDIAHIKFAFNKMESEIDFIELLNYVNQLIYGEQAIYLSLNQIKKLSDSEFRSKLYKQFSIKKKSGASRIIQAPCAYLSVFQKPLNLIFQVVYESHPSATGFLRGKSIVDNAKMHVQSFYIYNVDLKDFFSSITENDVFNKLQNHPFNLNKEKSKPHLAKLIAHLCCHKMEVNRFVLGEWVKRNESVLPQGASTSPILSNIICNNLDFNLSELANKFSLRYSRYADDITFSSNHNVYQKDSDFLKELRWNISLHNFHINERKVRLQKKTYKQEVTGLIVNEKANIPSRYIKRMRLLLYLWEHYKYSKASECFIKHYLKDKGNTKKFVPEMYRVIEGKLNYIKMVKGATNPVYIKLKQKYDLLNLERKKLEQSKYHINQLIEAAN